MIRLPECSCPYCDYQLDTASSTEGNDSHIPTPGDYSICFSCAQILVYADDLTLRKPTKEEHVFGVVNIPQLTELQRKIRNMDRSHINS